MRFPMSNESKAVLSSFSKRYGPEEKNGWACREIDFEAEKGKITGLLGPNGAGKSTLIKTLCGIQYATSGNLCVCGLTDFTDIRRVTGYVPETPELEENLTVIETLRQESFLRGDSRQSTDAFLKSAMKMMDLSDVASKKIKALSKGYRQRVSLARAVSFDSKVLVLDEFSGGLDPAQIVKIRKSIKKLSADKIVILSTHHIEEAESLCDLIYIMDRGTVVAKGSVQEILKQSGRKNLEEAFLSLTHGGD
ncbi:MAG TPA: ABC transporter ATP-binding protein [Treponema sp.]|nr:ABC transporter ATP-binding protein [Treponema sp.]